MRRFTRAKSVRKLSARAPEKRVVKAHLEVRMRVHSQGGIEPARIEVVEQHAHAHPPLGRLPERLEQQVADLISMPDEVPHVKLHFRGRGEQHARGEGVEGSASAWIPVLSDSRRGWRDCTAELSRPCRRKRRSWSALPAMASSHIP
jgi:hypothetical protein